MSQQQLWTIIGRAKMDKEFFNRLFANFPKTLDEENYQLDNDEIKTAQKLLSDSPTSSFPPAAMPQQNFAFENKLKEERMLKQVERINELSMYTVQILKNTLTNAANTYKTITRMNVAMFGVGIGLFVFAAFYAAFSKEKIYSLIFGDLGQSVLLRCFYWGQLRNRKTLCRIWCRSKSPL